MQDKQNISKPIVNRVANSGLNVFNLEHHYPTIDIVEIDLKPFLFKELILKEKDYRAALKEMDLAPYKGKIVVVYNSNEAIIPIWAYMLMATQLTGTAYETFQGTKEEYLKQHYQKLVEGIDGSEYQDERVVIKGCSNKPVPPSAYAAIASKLKPYAQSIMFGEPCSTVPIFKRPRKL